MHASSSLYGTQIYYVCCSFLIKMIEWMSERVRDRPYDEISTHIQRLYWQNLDGCIVKKQIWRLFVSWRQFMFIGTFNHLILLWIRGTNKSFIYNLMVIVVYISVHKKNLMLNHMLTWFAFEIFEMLTLKNKMLVGNKWIWNSQYGVKCNWI